ncbi:unnamed protein product [Spirodela intermedia]|uniref:BHLH domain-containing protein n=1 Tax=Spirodela intermedia TaxID=51605 RepID=A0A7I8I9C7_SPIIN|nr:unnamed protein product [Spirodela intermedia]CAA6653672.1 unnamed protein product [Spirodela intermedia]
MHPGPARMAPVGQKGVCGEGGGHREGASGEEAAVSQQSVGIRRRRKRRDLGTWSEEEPSKLGSTCSGNESTDCEPKRLKVGVSRDENGESKLEVETSSGVCNKLPGQCAQTSEASKQDYIHVRARRGQATDSHSLAERARREKISERMKILQDLVPGCNKVIGKASVLDEIINYIQSLQCQVEFLSMKLEAVNSRMNTGGEAFEPSSRSAGFVGQPPTREFVGQEPPQEWLHMQVGCGFERAA